ncbi:hypothetical protein BGZ98_004397 [Dissophora globulifera]|nr:hypothetical protein BGZ98_004397 [Dissophora globulifera]
MTKSMVPALQVPEILLNINGYLDLADSIAASQVNWLWYNILQPCLPTDTVYWKDTLPQGERDAALDRLCRGSVRSLECDFLHFEGRALHYHVKRQVQAKAWEPVKSMLLDDGLQLQRWVVRGGNFPDEDVFSILLGIKTLRHLSLDMLKGRNATPNIDKLFKILAVPSLQTLRLLTVKNAFWGNMGFPFPNKVRCQLRKIVVEDTFLSEANLARLLESCPYLEELVAIKVMSNWSPQIFKAISKTNPTLGALTISNSPSNAGIDVWSEEHMSWMVEHLNVNLRSLALHRLFCSPETFALLQVKFQDLTRLEIHGISNDLCGQMVHRHLSTFSQLQHLVAKDVRIPTQLLHDESLVWVCHDLRTLAIGFQDSDSHADSVDEHAETTRFLFEYLVQNVPELRSLSIQRYPLSLRPGDGMELLKGLTKLEQFNVLSESLIPDASQGQELELGQREYLGVR